MSVISQQEAEPVFGLDQDNQPVLAVGPEMRALMNELSWASSFSSEDFDNNVGFFDKNPITREQTLYDRAQAFVNQGRILEESPIVGRAALHLAS